MTQLHVTEHRKRSRHCFKSIQKAKKRRKKTSEKWHSERYNCTSSFLSKGDYRSSVCLTLQKIKKKFVYLPSTSYYCHVNKNSKKGKKMKRQNIVFIVLSLCSMLSVVVFLRYRDLLELFEMHIAFIILHSFFIF